MRTDRLARIVPVALLALAALLPRTSGEEIDGYTVIALKDLASLKGSEGKRVCFEAKFSKVFGGDVKLELVGNDLVKIDQEKHARLFSALLDWKTPDGHPLEKERGKPRSNVRVFGTVGRDDSGNPAVWTERVDKLEDDAPYFNAKIDAALAKPQGQQTADGFYEISKEARARAELYKLDLAQVIRRSDRAGIEVERRLRKPGDAPAAIALGKRILELAGDIDEAIKLWGEIALDDKAPERERNEARELLLKNDAYLWRGEYVSYGFFKRAIGFVHRGEQWIRRERAELEDALAREQKNQLPPLALFSVPKLQAQGLVTRGESKEQVIGTSGYGYPRHVDRRVFRYAKTGKTVTFEQWVFENGSRVYLWDGLCSEVLLKATPWPEQ